MTDATDNTSPRSASALSQPPGKTRPIRQQLLQCFLMVTLVALGVGWALAVALGGDPAWGGHGLPGHGGAFWETPPFRIAIGILLIITAVGSVFYHLHRMIAGPLEKTAAAAGRMAEGNLSETITPCACAEIDRVGEGVNSLAVNFQEALILVWNQTETAIARIQRTTRHLAPDKLLEDSTVIAEELASARQELETMQMMVRSFELYDVTIGEGNVLTAKATVDTLN